MAEKSYPQIPTTVWWGIRALLQRSPSAKFDADMLAASLDVQTSAARAYLKQLSIVGIIDDEGKVTELGGKWRLDVTYSEAVKKIVEGVYDQGLITICPPDNVDRGTAKNWFMSQGLGEGSAGNKAATYELIASPSPGPSDQKKADGAAEARKAPRRRRADVSKPASTSVSDIDSSGSSDGGSTDKPSVDAFPLNVNIQIHISADATSDQIDSIFRSMRQHLHDK